MNIQSAIVEGANILKDRSKNLIKQIANLKTVTFYEKLGTIYDKTQRIRKLAAMLSDDLNLNKEKIQIIKSEENKNFSEFHLNDFANMVLIYRFCLFMSNIRHGNID